MRQPLNLRERSKIDPAAIQKILLIRLRRIGDVVMTTPAVTLLRQRFPKAEITYIVDEPYRDLVEGHPSLDRVIILPRKMRVKDFFRHIRRIRKSRYDVLVDFHGGPRASLLSLFSRAKRKLGYRIKYKHFIYDITVPREPQEGFMHSVESHISLIKAMGVSSDSLPSMSLPPVKKPEVDKIRAILIENRCEGHQIVALHIGAGNRFRDWGTEKIAALTNLLSQLSKVKIVLIGSQEDRRGEEEIFKRSKASLVSLVNRLNLRELKELISVSSLFVGPDSGPMHIAATTKTPVVAIFGPTLAEHFGPWMAKATVIAKDLDCRPCRQRHCIYEDFRCLMSITPEEVYRACLPFLTAT
ncbi:MAG: lipopolysaccharide heptosyltransferase II [Candidatus Aminicenantes bacterium]|nr:lipopolysaccharide heptosyltransferase II [Candidatus Aminicenantes bacterium]